MSERAYLRLFFVNVSVPQSYIRDEGNPLEAGLQEAAT